MHHTFLSGNPHARPYEELDHQHGNEGEEPIAVSSMNVDLTRNSFSNVHELVHLQDDYFPLTLPVQEGPAQSQTKVSPPQLDCNHFIPQQVLYQSRASRFLQCTQAMSNALYWLQRADQVCKQVKKEAVECPEAKPYKLLRV